MLKIKIRKHGSEFRELMLEPGPGREYVVGRAPTCDIVLDDLPGISRQHFKIQFVDDSWHVQVLSKFGNLTKDGQPSTGFTLTVHDAFKLSPYDFIALEDSQHKEEAAIEPQTFSKALAIIPTEVPQEFDENFQGDNEITSAGVFIGVPYLRISGPNQQDEVLRLEGKSWIAGRDENCSIVLKDATASRKQFRIDFEEDIYYITDAGSSNGTLINGGRVSSRLPLKSGDIISVQSLTIHFELRDPSFKERIQGLSENFINSPALIIEKEPAYLHPSFMPGSYAGDGGAIPLHYQGMNSLSHTRQPDQSKKKLLVYAAIVIVIIFGLFIFSDGNKKKDDANQVTGATNKFDHLSSAQRQLVVDSYNLANNFLLQGKYSNAQAQLQKIAEILGDEPYQDSRNLMAQCQTALDNEGKIAKIESERKRAEEVSKRLSEILYRCNQVSQTATSEQAIDQCLEEAINLDPGNDEINIQKDRVLKRISDATERASVKADYRARVQRAREMYNHARSLEAKGELLHAIDAYERLSHTTLPDPENRKTEATRKIASIKQSLVQKADEYIRTGQKYADQNNLKVAIGELIKAQKIDANNSKVNSLIRKYRTDLDAQLKELFATATIYEGNSRVESALEKWKQITELDRPDGEYYRKAKSKLKAYGSH